jgi:osmotically-inducible protein OsmY
MTVRASETEDRIMSSAKESNVFQTYPSDDAIKMESKEGVVTLTGTFVEGSKKSLAVDTVQRLPEVIGGDNQRVTTGEHAVDNSDAWVGAKVKTAPLIDRNASTSGTTVDVKDGVVTLRGEAASLAQKELSGEDLKDVEGAKEAKNEITMTAVSLQPTQTTDEKIDDASFIAQVKTPLPSHRPSAPRGLRMMSSP